MKHTIGYFPVVLIALILSCNNSNTNTSKEPIDDYSSKLDSLIKTTEPRSFNGLILITQKGETQYAQTYGYADFEKKTPISMTDNFRIQSNSKQITAVLTNASTSIARLCTQQLRIEQNVARYRRSIWGLCERSGGARIYKSCQVSFG